MFICNKYPAQTFLPIFSGSIIETVGIALLAWAVTTRRRPLVNGIMALSGVGTGLRFMPNTLHATGIWGSRIAAIMSVLSFCAPFGGTMAIGIMTSVFSNRFDSGVAALVPEISQSMRNGTELKDIANLDAIQNLPAIAQDGIRSAAATAVMWAFISILPFMVLSVIAAACLGNVWIKKRSKTKEEGGEAGEVGEAVLYSYYLWSVVRVRFRHLLQFFLTIHKL